MEQQTPCMNNSRDGQWALISSHLIIKLISRIILQSPFSEAIPLTLCMLGNFAYFLYSADLFFKLTFSKNISVWIQIQPNICLIWIKMFAKGLGWESSTHKSWLLFNKAKPGKMAIWVGLTLNSQPESQLFVIYCPPLLICF